MTVAEFYSGTDTSGKVPATLDEVIERSDHKKAQMSDVDELHQLLEIEEDPNWRGFVLGLAGLILYDLEDSSASRVCLHDAMDSFVHHLNSFDDVTNTYCQACYRLGYFLWEEGDWQQASAFMLRCVPHMHAVYSDAPVFVENILSVLAICYARMERTEEALALAEAAAFETERDCGSLETLLYAYADVRQPGKATSTLRHMVAHCSTYEHLPRVMDFAASHGLDVETREEPK